MRVAIHAEGPDDSVVLEEFARHFLGDIQVVGPPFARGRPSVFELLEKRLYATAGQAELLIVCVDSDLDPLHTPGAKCTGGKCPICRLNHIADEFVKRNPRISVPEVAIGVAVPAVESWLLFGRKSECTESGWAQQGKRRTDETKRALKRELYSERTTTAERHEILRREAKRVIALDELENHFPVGLAPLLRKLRMYP